MKVTLHCALVLCALVALLDTTVQGQSANWPSIKLGELYENCETLLADTLNIWWTVEKSTGKIWFAAESASEDIDYYTAFGLSGDKDIIQMNGGDVAIMDFFGDKARARDFYLQDVVPCMEKYKSGVCPDPIFDKGKDDIGHVFGAEYDIDSSRSARVIHYSRAANTKSKETDQPFDISKQGDQLIIWAMGRTDIDGEPGRHNKVSRKKHHIQFGRLPKKNCHSFLEGYDLEKILKQKSDPLRAEEP